MKTRPRKTSRVVPSLVFSATFIGVIPACALVACGGNEAPTDGGSDAASEVFLGVASVAYCCFDSGVADIGFVPDASADADATPADADLDAPEGG